MSRKLKFRAFHKNEKKMYNVFYFCSGFIKIEIGLGFEPSKAGINLFEPIMQFTGLKDKNGIDIYEGDIISYGKYSGGSDLDGKPCIHVVEWDEEHAGFHTNAILEQTHYSSIEIFGAEIIGNIYENPELLAK